MEHNTNQVSMETKPMGGFTNAMKTGFRTLSGSAQATFYELEHKRSSETFKRGDINRIIVDYATIGRGADCTIKFDDTDKTVSRLHAAIKREGDKYQLLHLSKTNPTILNGTPISAPTTLKSGDEIELSLGGPKFSFLIPGQNTVGSLPLSQRFTLMRQQVLKPYRTALISLSVVLLLVSTLSGYGIYNLNNKLQAEKQKREQLSNLFKKQGGDIDSLLKVNTKSKDEIKELQEKNKKAFDDVNSLKKTVNQLKQSQLTLQQPPPSIPSGDLPAPVQENVAGSIAVTYPGTYFVRLDKILVTYEDGTTDEVTAGYAGTGFVTNDGYLVTARHVVEPWNFIADENEKDLINLNILANNTKATIVSHLIFTNPQTQKSFDVLSNQFTIDTTADQLTLAESDGSYWVLRTAFENPRDIAFKKVDAGGAGLAYDAPLSSTLQPLAQLYIVGYPWGLGEQTNPIASECKVGSAGLENGLIYTNAKAFDHGNSGGPVFVFKDNEYKVVGVVSGGLGTATGIIVPIKYLKE